MNLMKWLKENIIQRWNIIIYSNDVYMKCKLSLIIEGMDRANVDEKYYLDIKTGRVFVSTDMGIFYVDNSEQLDEEFLYSNDILSLPGQYEINEYKIIKDFIVTIEDVQIKNQLLIVIQGSGAFRRFKDSCINFGIIEAWYKFKNNSYYELAKEWCIWNNIEFIDDIKQINIWLNCICWFNVDIELYIYLKELG